MCPHVPTVFRDETAVLGWGEVRSVQTLTAPGVRFSPDRRRVLEAGLDYFAFLNRLAMPFLGVRFAAGGAAVVRLFGITLLSFRAPEIRAEPGCAVVRYPIAAGLLVHRRMRGHGELRLEMHADRLVMAVEGYVPALAGRGGSRLRRRLYEGTQAAVHRRVAARYLGEWLARLLAEQDPQP